MSLTLYTGRPASCVLDGRPPAGEQGVALRGARLRLESSVELPVRGVSNSLNVALCASAVLYAGLPTWERGIGQA